VEIEFSNFLILANIQQIFSQWQFIVVKSLE